MYSLTNFLLLVSVSLWGLASAAPGDQSRFVPYSSSFSYPQPPIIQAEFTANFIQQKYDTNVNHPTAGFAYFSPSLRKVRADSANNGTLQGSLFDFNNMTADGGVENILVTFDGGLNRSQVSCSFFSIQGPGFPLFTPDMLNSTQAVFIGVEQDALHGPLNAWQLQFSGVIVTAFVNNNNTLLRYDFSSPGDALKTFTTTTFFNVVEGPISPGVFETDCV